MRSAERGPIPGSLFNAPMSDVMESGRIGIQKLSDTGQAQSGGDFAHFGIINFLGLAERLIRGGENHVFEQLRVGWIERLRVNFDGRNAAVAFGGDFDRSSATGRFDSALGELGLDLFHLLLHSRSLFHQFSDAGHGLLEVLDG